MQARDIPLGKLRVRLDARPLDNAALDALVESVAEIGFTSSALVRPKVIFESGQEAEGFEIIAGRHRFEAAQRLSLQTLPCRVCEHDDLHAELAMLDENLSRTHYDKAERALVMARREEIYLIIHPETRHGAVGNGRGKSRQIGDSTSAERFTLDTAKKIGRSERSVQRDVERGQKISQQALSMLAGTPLSSSAYLDALKTVPKEEQLARVEHDLSEHRATGRKPISPSDPPRNDFEVINKDHRALVRAWENAHPEARDRFLLDINAVIDGAPIMNGEAA